MPDPTRPPEAPTAGILTPEEARRLYHPDRTRDPPARGVLGLWLEAGTLATSRLDVHGRPQATVSLVEEASSQIDPYAMLDRQALQVGWLLLEDCPPWLVELYRLARRAVVARVHPLEEEAKRGRPRHPDLPPGPSLGTGLVFSARAALDRVGAPTASEEGAPVSDGWRVRWVCEELERARDRADARHIGEADRQQLVEALGAHPGTSWGEAVEQVEQLRAPIPMVLQCPRCHRQHVDAPQPEKDWTNPPHRSHECQNCGLVWRPADVATTGVERVQTRGSRDTPPPYEEALSSPVRTMLALHDALLGEKTPRGFGRAPNRGAVNTMLHYLLRDLVVYGARFQLEDFQIINRRCGAYATNGTFEPLGLDLYATALGAGNGSAADAWEAATGWEAWGWSGEHLTSVIGDARERRWYETSRAPSPLRRVGPASAIKIAGEWWRVYEIGGSLIKIAQYPGDDGINSKHTSQRKGIRRQRLDRAAWEKIAQAEGALHRESVRARLTLQADVPACVRARWGGEETDGVLAAGTVLRPTALSALERCARWGEEEAQVEHPRERGDNYPPTYTASMDAWRAALPGLPKRGVR